MQMRARALCALAACAVAPAPASAIHFLGRTHANDVAAFSFSDFVEAFNRTYAPGSEEWARRRAIYDEEKRGILEFLRGPPRPWTQGITEFMDYTGAERDAMLGYKGLGLRRGARRGSLELDSKTWSHPTSFSFAGGKLSEKVHSQGGCGSCWAHAAIAVLEGQAEAKGLQLDGELSVDSTTHCTPNPRHCGGSGGCGGATAELAYEMIKSRGAPLRSDVTKTMECEDSAFKKSVVGIEDYVTLPANKLHPLMQALYDTGGPIAVSADASGWFHYTGGVFSDMQDSKSGYWTVNHAVTLTAYRMPQGKEGGYWMIKNSWGPDYGENGYIRLEMKEDEESHCGMDRSTHEGLACDGDPDEALVCGTCGILYDSSYPTGVKLLR